MYLHQPTDVSPVRPALSLRLAVGVCTAATVGLGLFPEGLLQWISRIG